MDGNKETGRIPGPNTASPGPRYPRWSNRTGPGSSSPRSRDLRSRGLFRHDAEGRVA